MNLTDKMLKMKKHQSAHCELLLHKVHKPGVLSQLEVIIGYFEKKDVHPCT